MADERWAQISRIYNDAAALAPVDRAVFLRSVCGDDQALRAEIESLLLDNTRVDKLLDPEDSHKGLIGQRIGGYEIRSLLGVGGMGEVYRARDPKLDRDVAIKVLPVAFASDGERLARFQREARVLASLNHPYIGGIYGFEDASGVPALVLELVEGDTLAERLEKGPMPISEALPIARQIADALETAHEHSVVHRDLKPANIKITPEGTVKVLDFGLAKAVQRAESALQTSVLTHEGIVVGTPAYMSPEQARGKPVDRRADIWAFGCVLYEMLTGRVAFAAATVTDTLAAVLDREPDWSALPVKTPPAIRRLLRRCLEKDSRLRLHDMGDAGLELHDALTSPRAHEAPLTAHAGSRWLTALAVAAVLTALVLAIPALWHLRETPPPAPSEMRLDIVTPVTDDPTARAGSRQFSQFSFALSPDGRQIVFVASGDGTSRLWLRSLATTTAQPLAGTEGACCPFWAPSSRSLGFFAGGALKRLDLGGGAPQLLAPAENGNGGTWNTNGVIVFAPSSNAGLLRVSATGGATTTVTTPGPLQQRHIHPRFLPDGHRFLFSVDGRSDTEGIYLGALDGSAPTQLVAANTDGAPAYLPSGWMFWGRAGTLVAQRLDVAQAILTGEPVTVAEGALGVSVGGIL